MPKTHGLSKHPLYSVWAGMKRRCYNPNEPAFGKYGGVGITVCDEWKHDAKAFIDWALDNGWKKGLHLDKDILCKQQNIHPKVYAPHTCQFITQKQNLEDAISRNNKGAHCKISDDDVKEIKRIYKAKEMTQTKLAEVYGISQTHVSKLINNKY